MHVRRCRTCGLRRRPGAAASGLCVRQDGGESGRAGAAAAHGWRLRTHESDQVRDDVGGGPVHDHVSMSCAHIPDTT